MARITLAPLTRPHSNRPTLIWQTNPSKHLSLLPVPSAEAGPAAQRPGAPRSSLLPGPRAPRSSLPAPHSPLLTPHSSFSFFVFRFVLLHPH